MLIISIPDLLRDRVVTISRHDDSLFFWTGTGFVYTTKKREMFWPLTRLSSGEFKELGQSMTDCFGEPYSTTMTGSKNFQHRNDGSALTHRDR